MSLAEQLGEISRRSRETFPAHVLEIIRKQIDDLSESDIPQQGAKPGDRMPQIELLDLQGNVVPLRELCAKGPVILSFYRGGW